MHSTFSQSLASNHLSTLGRVGKKKGKRGKNVENKYENEEEVGETYIEKRGENGEGGGEPFVLLFSPCDSMRWRAVAEVRKLAQRVPEAGKGFLLGKTKDSGAVFQGRTLSCLIEPRQRDYNELCQAVFCRSNAPYRLIPPAEFTRPGIEARKKLEYWTPKSKQKAMEKGGGRTYTYMERGQGPCLLSSTLRLSNHADWI